MEDRRLEALRIELRIAAEFRKKRDWSRKFRHLERAHVLGQISAWHHSTVYLRMLAWALRRADAKEQVGQLLRLIVAAPASTAGKFPVGNTGGSNVSAFAPMAIPEDIREFVQEQVNTS